jgi:hypothetical protein
MAAKDRIIVDGEPQDFTCKNIRFETNIKKGQPHIDQNSEVLGNALDGPLAMRNDYSLWLEYVIDNDQNDWYWLMWYKDGIPTIPMSGVMSTDDLCKMRSPCSRRCAGCSTFTKSESEKTAC